MRKTAYLALAALALASCSNDDTLRTADPTPIGFSGSFIDNSTRAIDPSYSNNNNKITEFYVWGTLTPSRTDGTTPPVIKLYDGDADDKVYSTKAGESAQAYGQPWWCDHVEYWVPNATYRFAAVANHGNVNVGVDGLPNTIWFDYTDGTKDLIYTKSVVNVTTDVNAAPITGVTTDKIVAFTFDHLLSLVQFEFTNTSANDNYYYTIEDIKLSGLRNSATYTVSNEKWTYTTEESNNSESASFGHATDATTADANAEIILTGENKEVTSNYARMIIPSTYSNLGVSFTQKLYYDIDEDDDIDANELIHEKEINKALTPNSGSVTFSPNHSYKITVDLNPGTEIKFTVKETGGINGWVSGSEQEFNP